MSSLRLTGCSRSLKLFTIPLFVRSSTRYTSLRALSQNKLEHQGKEPAANETDESPDDYKRLMRSDNMYSPTPFDKKVLVWVKRYKNVNEVPNSIPFSIMDKSRSKARIKFSNYSIVATILGCFGMAMIGKWQAEQGQSLHQMNLDWHKSMK